MREILNNDSTKKQLGFEYQKLIALEYCLNAKDGEYVYIECFGDVQYGGDSIEVKHHLGESNLTSNSVDVWKTLKNIVVEYSKLKANDKFILHTTQEIPENSIFYGWNKLDGKNKYRKLKAHPVSETSKHFKNIIFDTRGISKANLVDILEKFTIDSSKPKIGEKFEQLKEHSVFKLIPDEFRKPAIGVLIQYLVSRAIDDSNKWEINITDFNSDLRVNLSKYTKDYFPFPTIEEPKRDDTNLTKGYKFIEKLKSISIRENDLHQAFQDYARSEQAYQQILKINPTLKENVISYESGIEYEIKNEKSSALYDLSIESFKDDTYIRKSREVYFSCIKKPHRDINGFTGTEMYFRNGRIYNINETTDFEWLYKETDI
ncbi:hypothetical protein CGC58_09970 [Capnocytophaga stomatis]|uniref:Uncharacterized protein n=1 Tax=Capnocytophaga stomatis TaxID=1848904 RepID=A0A250G111_9FLAO|nr:hypothetical protein [Capnocytophaga stomatis]ATA90018.1 hypothetical protein CGC58_09970 [Capnocytophaga stomatis]GIM50635.1 hypothetical protein CAPN003_20870 [Capnocytophaga stomatis]